MSKNSFELMWVSPVIPNEEQEALVDKYTDLITDAGGRVAKIDRWGEKVLAYSINNNTRGVYVLVSFDASRSILPDLDRRLRMDDKILRHMLIQKG